MSYKDLGISLNLVTVTNSGLPKKSSVIFFSKFSISDYFSRCDQSKFPVVTEEIRNGKLHFLCNVIIYNAKQKMKFSIMDFFSKCDQIHSFSRISSHLMMKSLMENLIFCAVYISPSLMGQYD